MARALYYTALLLARALCYTALFLPQRISRGTLRSLFHINPPRAKASAPRGEVRMGGFEDAQRSWRRLQGDVLRRLISFAAFTMAPPAVDGALRKYGAEYEQGGEAQAGAAEAASLVHSKRFTNRTLGEKLANVPVFVIVNRDGMTYLTPQDDTQQCVLFTSVEDAEQMMMEMLQSPSFSGDCRLLVLSLEKAYEMMRGPQRTTGGSRGRSETIEYVFHPSEAGREKAAGFGLGDIVADVPVPVYYADGLQVTKDGAAVRPIFLDAQDLYDAWFRARPASPGMPQIPRVRVFNLPEVIVRMEEAGGGTSTSGGDYADFAFFPSSKSVKFAEDACRQGGTSARLPSLRIYSEQ